MSELTLPTTALPKSAPFRLGGHTAEEIHHAWTMAAGIVAIFGVVIFGVDALRLICISMAMAALCDYLFVRLTGIRTIGGLSHSILTGLLLALTLPAQSNWYVAMVGAVIAIAVKALFSTMGHYIWQPALVGRVFVQFAFSGTFALAGTSTQWPVLAPGHMLVGRLGHAKAVDLATYDGFSWNSNIASSDAWLMPPTSAVLRAFADGKIPTDGDLVYFPLMRDNLPPWKDTIFGTVPGGIGETCSLALIIAGLYLIYRGYLRWQLPVAIIASAALAAAVLPIAWPAPQGGFDWFPGFSVEKDRAVGLAYLLYHLTGGQILLGAFLLAGDMISSPRRVNGQIAFGIGIGVITIFMRLYGVLEGECYWAILIMNTFVPLINRRWRRSVLGMAEAT